MRSLRFLLPLLALALMGAASKPKVTVRFHTEANPVGGEQFTVSAKEPTTNRPITLSKFADISEGDIDAIYPFPASDGTLGCAFKLDNHGRVALQSLSQEYRGALLFAFVNARPVAAMLIDKRISDGIVTIPRGLTLEEVALLRKEFHVLGEKKGKDGKPEKGASAPLKAKKTASGEFEVPAPLQQSGD